MTALVLDWLAGPALVAADPRCTLVARRPDIDAALADVDRVVHARRARGGSNATGVALLVGYEALDRSSRSVSGVPDLVAIEVDRSADEEDTSAAPEAAVATGPVSTSLPRPAYLAAVERVRAHILDGDVYQANLCQMFEGHHAGSPRALWRALQRAAPAPRAAWLEIPGLAVASLSPETFLTVRPPDAIATFPIKGTRPRGVTAEQDAALRRELETSAKEAAELLMIVDLMRNDLGRVCRTGSITVPELGTTRTYPNVHHRVARIEGRLRAGVEPSELIRAVFPGGSITGAPKQRAREILETLEPVARGPFTGSLFWFGDDGSLDSSILIRTAVFTDGRFLLGAGGGIVIDSNPEAEWRESCDKIRPWATALGFGPEDAR